MSKEYKAEQCQDVAKKTEKKGDEGLDALNVKALREEAKKRGVNVKGLRSRKEIIEAIKSAEEEEEGEEEKDEEEK